MTECINTFKMAAEMRFILKMIRIYVVSVLFIVIIVAGVVKRT